MSRLGRSYKQAPVDERYDAIVIGSGLGGMTTALLLAQRGKRVAMLERHYVLGGFTHVFRRKGYEWDVGVHYVGEVHRPRSILRQLFDHVTDGELRWAEMGEVYDRIVFGDEEYPLRAGVSAFKEGLREKFPTAAHAKAIDAYVDLVFSAVASSRNYFIEKAMGSLSSWAAGGLLRRKYLRHTRKTTWEVLRSLTDDLRLIGVLTGQYGDYGLPPRQSSFGMHASLVKHYFAGGCYPVGGSARIAQTIVPRIEAAGGVAFTNAEVESLLVEDGTAVGVRMDDGREIRAPLVISNTGVPNTFGRLVPGPERERLGLGGLTQRVQPSASHVSLYIGLDRTAEQLRLPRANYWIYPDEYDHDLSIERFLADESAPLPVAYISFPSAKDPEFESRHPGRATIEVVTLAPWERFERWADRPWKKRGSEYAEYKERLTQRLLEPLLRFEPQVREHIELTELSTPLSTRHFTAYGHGEIYGLSHDPERFEHRFLRPRTPLRGLYLTGQDIVTCGVGGALLSGFLTASAITGENLVMKTLG
ncbi:phytoene desaturase family protein [Paraliomyxa miuraensis]|uniref:phytoene desaturase family protein n=1 Tax=Paraliomyxa miuraensis TaxID=376150 RepID=UPI00224FF6F6|nr:NAD(P)/FAD-dependent oxidoreductase [Paraliomyxa miuraensis]MCX4243755.1 NAD(P)/FAD-dependent oxidoreductase [Paraliomyxa miuraensis]